MTQHGVQRCLCDTSVKTLGYRTNVRVNALTSNYTKP